MDAAVNRVDEIALLREQLKAKEALLDRQEQRIDQLESLIRQLRQQHFGASSEKLSADQLALFDESEATTESALEEDAATETPVAAHSRSKPKRITLHEDLPREEVIYDLTEAEKVCPHDGASLKEIGCETHEQLEFVPAQVKVIKHLRKKYACPCCDQYMVTAKKPKQPIEKGIAAPGLLSYISVSKYADALPLYRLVELFKRVGVELDRTTLANWMIRCGELVQPLINRIHEHLLAQSVLHMDETPVQVLKEPGKTPQSKSTMWVLASSAQSRHLGVLFHYSPHRSQDIPTQLLHDFQGALMVDGYEGYRAVCETNGISRLGCFAHARRKFIEAKQQQPKGKTGKADQALSFIQKLYLIERQTKDQALDAEQRHKLRQQARPILDKLKQWLDKTKHHTPPKNSLGKAIYYLEAQWPRLIRYVDHGDYPIDNNHAENRIRPFVIGRKNWLFSNSQRGAASSANLYSLIETAKLNGLEPYAYLKEVFTQLPNAQTLEQVDGLLPWNYKGAIG